MTPDPHVGESGSYEIRSIYFDDMYDTCYMQNESGVDPRSKFRIRAYNASDKVITLEKKCKQNGMTKKYQQKLDLDLYQKIMRGELGESESNQLLRELILLQQTRMFQPKTIVCYERTPFIEKDGNVRVTFDDYISSASDFDQFFEKDLHKRPIMPLGKTLMEVKYDEFLPAYIKENLETGRLAQTTFSKYYLCRKYGL